MRSTTGTLVIAAAVCVLLPLLAARAAPQSAQPDRRLWEYRTASLLEELSERRTSLRVSRKDRYKNLEGRINKLGDEGWELCHAAEDLFIFKRPKAKQ